MSLDKNQDFRRSKDNKRARSTRAEATAKWSMP
jgi:hypothetical protein